MSRSALASLKSAISRLLPGDELKRGISVLVGGTMAGQAVVVLAAPVLTRLYTPQQFGLFQLYISAIGFAIIASTWRYELAILLPESDRTAFGLLVLSMAIVLLMSGLLAVIVGLSGPVWQLPTKWQPLRPFLWLAPITVAGAGIYNTLSYWAFREKAYPDVAKTKFIQASSQAGVQVGLGLLGHFGVLGLMLGDAIGRMGGTIRLGMTAWKKGGTLLSQTSRAEIAKAAYRYRAFPLISTGSAIINTAGFSIPMILIAEGYDTTVLGWFALVDRCLGMPSALIGQAVSQVYMSQASHLSRAGSRQLRSFFRKLAKKLFLAGLAPALLLALVAPWFFVVIFGPDWREAGYYARILILMHFSGFVAWPLMPTLNILERQTWQLGWDVGRLVITAGCLAIGPYLGWSPRAAILGYSIAMAAAYAAHLLISDAAIGKAKGSIECVSA